MQNENKNMLDSALCKCGEDMDSLEYIYNETFLKVCSVCYSVLFDDPLTEDAAQQTYIRLTEKYKKYKPGTNPLAFILKVAVNVAREYRNSSYRYIQPDGEYEKGDDGQTINRVISDMYTDKLLSCLSEKQRVVVMLYVYSGLTFDEIAHVTGAHPNTVRARYKKAIDILKTEVTENEKK